MRRQVNPVKKKFFPRHEATIKKDPECQVRPRETDRRLAGLGAA